MNATTLLEVMLEHSQNTQSDSALHCWNPNSKDYTPVSYRNLSQRAFAFGEQVQAESDGDGKDRVVMIACHSPYATLVAFYGAISIGAIPMIFPMPLSLGSHEALTERIHHWGYAFEQTALLVLEEGLEEKFHADIPTDMTIMRLSEDPNGEWPQRETPASNYVPAKKDIAFFQTTSSSTGDHKAVSISHENIMANVYGIKLASKMDDNERMATWLPLFHDMGLVGTVLFCFGNNFPLYIMTPTQFVKRPINWVRTLAEENCSIATMPNFGFDYCTRLVSDKDIPTLDLNKVKHLYIGAEPIRVSTVEGFINKFSSCGISPQKIRPAYGLAESTIITSIFDPEGTANFLYLDADSVGMGEKVKILDKVIFDDPKLADYDASTAMAVCTGGSAIKDMLIEIIDEEGNVLGEGIAGEIAITGTSVAMGYVDGEEGDQLVNRFDQGRLGTGDMGMIVDGELYILERIKNLIIRNGENYLVSALEEQLAELLDISHEHVAVFDSDIHDPTSDIVVMVERHKPISEEQVDELLVAMPKEAFPISKILLSKSREIPRTTSGKKRHFYCRKMYQKDEIVYQQAIEISPQLIMQAMNRQKG